METGLRNREPDAFLFAGQVHYIEQQAPFIHAGFFSCFMKSVIRRYTLLFHLEQVNDFGTDAIWCKAASAFEPLEPLTKAIVYTLGIANLTDP